MSTGNRKRRRAAGLLPEPQKCVARNRRGDPCRLPPVKGAAVCHKHGGSAPQVKRKAAERIANASDVAAVKLVQLIQDPSVPYAIQLAAAKDLLDRAEVTGKAKVELEVKPWEELLSGIVADVPEGAPMREFPQLAEGTALVVDAERVDTYAPDDSDWSHPAASDAEPSPPQPSSPPPPRRVNGDERLPQVRRRLDGEDYPLPPPYEPSYRPRSRRGRHR